MASLQSVHNEPELDISHKEVASQQPCTTCGPHFNAQVADFDFENKVENLSFKLNLGDVPLEKGHQAKLIDFIYNNQRVSFLHDEDLAYCNQLSYNTLASTDNHVYLPHRKIPRQGQGVVCRCLNNCFHQGIIYPSNSPCASQAVIFWGKSGKIYFHVDNR